MKRTLMVLLVVLCIGAGACEEYFTITSPKWFFLSAEPGGCLAQGATVEPFQWQFGYRIDLDSTQTSKFRYLHTFAAASQGTAAKNCRHYLGRYDMQSVFSRSDLKWLSLAHVDPAKVGAKFTPNYNTQKPEGGNP